MLRKKIALFLYLAIVSAAANNQDSMVFHKVKKGVVSISSHVHESLYERLGKSTATGFIANKEQGFVVTNSHVANNLAVSTHTVSFFNGRQCEGRLMYADPYHDFALLKVDPEHIPQEAQALQFAQEEPKMRSYALIVGSNEGLVSSFQSGWVSQVYSILGTQSTHTIQFVMNTRGGSSGSPVVDGQGHVVGLNFAGGERAFSVHIDYIKRVLQDLKQGITPERWDLDIQWHYKSTSSLRLYHQFPAEIIARYWNTNPHFVHKALVVKRLYKNGRNHTALLKPGDVLILVNDKPIGPMLSTLHGILDRSHGEPVQLAILRHGVLLTLSIAPRRLFDGMVRQYLTFAGAVFFQADLFIQQMTGCLHNAVILGNIKSGSPFHVLPWTYFVYASHHWNNHFWQVIAIDHHPVDSFEAFLQQVHRLELEKKTYFLLTYRTLMPTLSFSGIHCNDRDDRLCKVVLDQTQYNPRRFFQKNQAGVHQWQVQPLSRYYEDSEGSATSSQSTQQQ